MTALTATALLMAATLLAGCSGGSAASPAVSPLPAPPGAAEPGCVRLLTQVPATLLERDRTATAVRGTARWGDVVLRCGVASPAPTTASCITTDGVDWVFTETDREFVFTSYGRTPTVEVRVPTTVPREQAPGAMTGLADIVRPLPQERSCI